MLKLIKPSEHVLCRGFSITGYMANRGSCYKMWLDEIEFQKTWNEVWSVCHVKEIVSEENKSWFLDHIKYKFSGSKTLFKSYMLNLKAISVSMLVFVSWEMSDRVRLSKGF